jgi:hypothetical protein
MNKDIENPGALERSVQDLDRRLHGLQRYAEVEDASPELRKQLRDAGERLKMLGERLARMQEARGRPSELRLDALCQNLRALAETVESLERETRSG